METNNNAGAGRPATDCYPSSETPRTDGKIKHLESKCASIDSKYKSISKFCKKLERETTHSRRMQKKLVGLINHRTFERDKAISEIKRWKDLFAPFAIVHAENYVRDHYGDLCMHFAHYDLLEEHTQIINGFRIDPFSKPPVEPEPSDEMPESEDLM